MRAQYHFRQRAEGLCAWDVQRLIELARELPRERVRLTAIAELDEAYWSGGEGQRMTCRQVVEHAWLMEESDLAHPIVLSSDGRVMDGMHRVCKALMEGRDAVMAVRFSEDPAPDYVNVRPEDLPYGDE